MKRFKRWLTSKILGPFKYTYEYHSPFGEEWTIYRMLFGFIHIKHYSYPYKIIDNVENYKDVRDFVNKLNQHEN